MASTDSFFILFIAFHVCSLIGVISAVTGSDSSSNKEYLEADKFLMSYGYYTPRDILPTNSRNASLRTFSDTERTMALKRLQKFYHLPKSGQLDKETTELMLRPRCGNADITSNHFALRTRRNHLKMENIEEISPRRRENSDHNTEKLEIHLGMERRSLDMSEKKRMKRYKLMDSFDDSIVRWHTDVLTWKITRPTYQLHIDTQRDIMKRALAAWAKHVPIKFVEEKDNRKPAIEMWFASGKHGYSDSDPIFDGRKPKSNVLAHAFDPGMDPYSMYGDIHFDDDEDWTDPDALFVVALHEIGHTLGLDHSDDKKAVMHGYFKIVDDLAKDDIRGVEAIYGSGDTEGSDQSTPRPDRRFNTPTLSSVSRELIAREQCIAKLKRVDAVFKDPSTQFTQLYFVLSGDELDILSTDGAVVRNRSLQCFFPHAPLKPYVVFSDSTKNRVSFIKDGRLWQYTNYVLSRHQRMSKEALPETPKFSFTIEKDKGGSEILLFGDRHWWSFDEKKQGKPGTYRPISESSKTFPTDITFAVQWTDGLVYAVKTDDSYITLNRTGMKIVQSKPIRGKPKWLVNLCNLDDHISRTIYGKSSCTMTGISRTSLMIVVIVAIYLNGA